MSRACFRLVMLCWRCSSDSSPDWSLLCESPGADVHQGRCRFSDVYSPSPRSKDGDGGATSDESEEDSNPDEEEVAAEMGACLHYPKQATPGVTLTLFVSRAHSS